MKKIITICLLLLFVVSCNSQRDAAGKQDVNSFEILKQDGYHGREKAGNVLINSQNELKALYSELNIEEVPAVDFTKKSVAAVFSGQKSSGGHSITITDVKVNDGVATVKVIKTKPEPGQPATMALTSPYCIASISKATSIKVSE